jgi:hypothetical protein
MQACSSMQHSQLLPVGSVALLAARASRSTPCSSPLRTLLGCQQQRIPQCPRAPASRTPRAFSVVTELFTMILVRRESGHPHGMLSEYMHVNYDPSRYGARFPAETSTRGCHWFPRLLASSDQACDQWHSSRVSTFLTSSHCKLRPNTEGIGSIIILEPPPTKHLITKAITVHEARSQHC